MKTLQLFLLPFAGGSSLSFMRVKRFLDNNIEVIPVEYSGRGCREREPLIENYDDFLADVAEYMKGRRDDNIPYAILGYSLGSAIALDVCCKNLLDLQPVHAFFCAEGGLLSPNPARNISMLEEGAFEKEIVSLGGIDKRLLDNRKVFDQHIQVIKKDHNILCQYKYMGGKAECNATVIYSPLDESCVNILEWSKVVSGKVDYIEMGENHFFINQKYKELAEIVNKELSNYVFKEDIL